MSTFLSRFIIFILFLLRCFHCKEENTEQTPDTTFENPANATHLGDEPSSETEELQHLLNTMYGAITHGDQRYFRMLTKKLSSNQTYSDLLISDDDIMESIEANFIHILNTMHMVSEMAIKIHATPVFVYSPSLSIYIYTQPPTHHSDRSKVCTIAY